MRAGFTTDANMSYPAELELSAELRDFLEGVASTIPGGLFWGGDRWTARIGDEQRGPLAEATFKTLDDALEWLRARAIERRPDSDFAADYRRGAE
jgi:hypothetical protein